MYAHASMNRIFRLVWSEVLGAWVAVAESAKGKGKGGGRRQLLAPAMAALSLSLAHAGAPAADTTQLPTGFAPTTVGTVHEPVTNGKVMTITQTTARAAIDWQTFNVAQDARVKFAQPDRASVTLNRVLAAQPSQILGQITADGQVFLSNPNGVYFGKSASVDVGGLVATTHDLSIEDFEKGRYVFKRGSAKGSVLNEGALTAKEGGYIALLAADVRNSGGIVATAGTAALAAGETITLTFEGDTKLTGVEVKPRDLQDLVARGLAVMGTDGMVVLAPGAAEQLRGTVVNSGAIAANGLSADGGRILLRAADSVVNSGTLSADAGQRGKGGVVELTAELSNPDSVTELNGTISARGGRDGGAGGAVTTAAAKLLQGAEARVDTTALVAGDDIGTWTLQSNDYTVGAGGDKRGATLSAELELSGVALVASTGSIHINDAVSWHADSRLALTAAGQVSIDAAVTGNGAQAGLTINPNQMGQDDSEAFVLGRNGKVSLPALASAMQDKALVLGKKNYTVINSLGQQRRLNGADPKTIGLQDINSDLAGNYALGSDINAADAATWNDGKGLAPLGDGPWASFQGRLEGFGHTIDHLTINAPERYYNGLFGFVGKRASISNVVLSDFSITGGAFMGALAGANEGRIVNSRVSGRLQMVEKTGISVRDTAALGGMVGDNAGRIAGAAAAVEIRDPLSYVSIGAVGGLVGRNTGDIDGSVATGTLDTSHHHSESGGLVGFHVEGEGVATIRNSHADVEVKADGVAGGLVGRLVNGLVDHSYATGNVTNWGASGGLVGSSDGPRAIRASYATGAVTGGSKSGGLVGENLGDIESSYASGAVVGLQEVGGLVGRQRGGKVLNTFAVGTVTGGDMVGGLIGQLGENAVVSNSYATGAVLAITHPDFLDATNMGGLIGSSFGTVTNSFWSKESSGLDVSAGGTPLTRAQMKEAKTYTDASWDLPAVWQIDSAKNKGYPCLTATACPVEPPLQPVVPPVQPVTPPVEPVTPPVQPVTPPVEPVTPPVQPVTPPVQPVTPPVQPVTPPVQPVTPPVQPVTPPVQPVTPPVQPVTPPVEPVTPPVQPVTPPVQPVTPPVQPVTPPVQPVTPPVQPVTPPVQPVTPPVQPVTPPVQPVTPPVQPVTPPVQPVTPPVQPVTPPLAPRVPLRDNAKAAAIADTAGVRVVLVKQWTDEAHPGLVAVSIPAQALEAGPVHFSLAGTVDAWLSAGGALVRPTLLDGGSAPPWLGYSSQQRMTLTAAPVDALPLKVQVVVDGRRWTIVLLARTGQ